MMYAATSKQKSYFTALTGEWLPFNCSKSKASTLIKQALAGTYKKKEQVIKVSSYRIDCPSHRDHGKMFWEIDVDYRCFAAQFETQEQAMEVAKAKFPGQEIQIGGQRTQMFD